MAGKPYDIYRAVSPAIRQAVGQQRKVTLIHVSTEIEELERNEGFIQIDGELAFRNPTYESMHLMLVVRAAIMHTKVHYPLDAMKIVVTMNAQHGTIAGRSMGLALAVSVAAAASRKRVPHNAMFAGEVDPEGNILPVGALQFKAHPFPTETLYYPAAQSGAVKAPSQPVGHLKELFPMLWSSK